MAVGGLDDGGHGAFEVRDAAVAFGDFLGDAFEEGVDLVHPVAADADREAGRLDVGGRECLPGRHGHVGPVVVRRVHGTPTTRGDYRDSPDQQHHDQPEEPHHGTDRAMPGESTAKSPGN
ncbi:MAG TPA: hypothetical protein VIQ79_08345 [Kribbella sp.]